MRGLRRISVTTMAALVLGAAGVQATDLSDDLRAAADLCRALAHRPAEERIGAVAALGYVRQQAPFSALRAWSETPIGQGESTPDEFEKRWQRHVRSYDLTDKYDAFVLFAAPSDDRLLSITHPDFQPEKDDGSKFECSVRGYGWLETDTMHAAMDAAGYTAARAEHLQLSEPHVNLVTRYLPGNDDRDIMNVASFRTRKEPDTTSRPVFVVTVILYLTAPTS